MTALVEQQPESYDEQQRRLAEVEKEIAETLKRMPAHSVKPPIMHQLFALEEERERLIAQLAARAIRAG